MTRRQEDRDRIMAALAREVDQMAVSGPDSAPAANSPHRARTRPQSGTGAVPRRGPGHAKPWKQRRNGS
ncbi:hypothetical protein OH768_00925 [Streptomyces sp. NBC_01622]|uniref:hypothetical protein n=1 Tax=Streptomyces sp. NBC_01622 TaxID=2975903 RepID=UPI00386D5D93|nr:hypothetical protein OH768_00925 [Streptomyces sp. NBC_01622]